MTILHQVQHSANEGRSLHCCLRYAAVNDVIVLVGNGVNSIIDSHTKLMLANKQVLLLEDDVIARGLTAFSKQWQLINYAEFVTLTLEHEKVISW